MTAAISATLLVLISAAIGFGWSRLVAPGVPAGLPRLAASIGWGLVVWTLAATALTLVGLLAPAAVVIALVALAIVPFAWRRIRGAPAGPGRARSRPLDQARLVAGSIAVVGIVVAVAAFALPSHFERDQGNLPVSTTVWYYARLATDVRAAGGFPETLTEWGGERPFQTDYGPFTAQSAAAFAILPGDLLDQLEAYRLAILVSAFLLAALLLRRWFSTWTALVGAVLLLGSLRAEDRFLSYRPEAFALALGLFALFLADRAIVDRRRGPIAVAVLATGLVLAAHAEVFIVLVAAIAAIGAVRGPLAPTGRWPWQGISLRRARWAAPAVAVLVLAAGGAVGFGLNAVIAGDFRLAGYASGGGADAVVIPPSTPLPVGWQSSGDPTWDFFVAATGPAETDLPQGFADPRLLPRSAFQFWPWLNAARPPGSIVFAAIVLGVLALWPIVGRRRRSAFLIALGFGIALLAGSFVLYSISSTYVPQRVGGRRLMPYEFLLPAVALTCLLATAWQVARGRVAFFRTRGGRVAGAVAGLAIAVATISLPLGPLQSEPGLTPTGAEAFAWIHDNQPPGSIILTNAYTDGSVSMLTGGTGLVDGRAVYLEDPEFLGRATSLLLGARRFFEAPGDAAADDWVDKEGVDLLLVVGKPGDQGDVAGYRPFRTDWKALAASGRYTLLREFGDGRLLLYAVKPASAAVRSDRTS